MAWILDRSPLAEFPASESHRCNLDAGMANDSAYMKAYMKRRYAERRAEALERLGGACAHCGSVDDLQIDHVDRFEKTMKFERMTMVGRERWDAELAKCQLLCFPCHIVKTRECWDGFGKKSGPITDDGHGSGCQYVTRRCRCPECRSWASLYRLGRVRYDGWLTEPAR